MSYDFIIVEDIDYNAWKFATDCISDYNVPGLKDRENRVAFFKALRLLYKFVDNTLIIQDMADSIVTVLRQQENDPDTIF